MRGFVLGLLLGTAVVLVPLNNAHANPACPSTVHGTVALDADLLGCTQGLTLDGPATIKLNGFTLGGTGAGTAIGNHSDPPFALKVLGPGTITNWGAGIYSVGSTQVRNVTITDITSSGGIFVQGDNAKVERNTLDQVSSAIDIDGDKAKVLGNTITNVTNAGLLVTGDKAQIRGNTVTGASLGIELSGDKGHVEGNTASTNGSYGIFVTAGGLSVQIKGNTADGNGSGSTYDGIFVWSSYTTVAISGNETSNNSAYGFDAPAIAKAKNNTGTGNALGLCNPSSLCA